MGVIKRCAKRVFQSLPSPLNQLVRVSGTRIFGLRSYRGSAEVVLGPREVSFGEPRIEVFVQETYKWPKQLITTSVGANGVYRDPGVGLAQLSRAIVSGDGRVFDRSHRLVRESLATHDYQAVNFGLWTQRPDEEIDGLAINLNWWSGNTNVYHWLRDVFSRAYVLASVSSNTAFSIIGPSDPTPFQQHGFDALVNRFPQARYVGVKYGHKVLVESLLLPCMAPYVRGCGYLRPEVVGFVQDAYRSGIAPADVPTSTTYISRANTASRRLVNEAEVLERIGERVALNALRIEELEWREQIAVMQSTNVLVGVYGAGLTHLLFTRGGGVVEIHNGDSTETHFSTLAAGCGVPFAGVQGGPADRLQDFALSTKQTDVLIGVLEQAVKRAEHRN